MSIPSFLNETAKGVILRLKVQPRASKNAIENPMGDELRVKVTAPPVDAAANDALLKLLSSELDYPRNRLELIRGQASRHKQVMIYGMSASEILQRLAV